MRVQIKTVAKYYPYEERTRLEKLGFHFDDNDRFEQKGETYWKLKKSEPVFLNISYLKELWCLVDTFGEVVIGLEEEGIYGITIYDDWME